MTIHSFSTPSPTPPQKKTNTTPNTIQLSFNKKCVLNFCKKNNPPPKKQPTRWPNNLYESQLTHQQKQPTNRWVSQVGIFGIQKNTPNLCSKTADPRQTPVAPMAWTQQRPSRPCCVMQDPHPQHSWLPRRNRSCDLRDIFSMATNGMILPRFAD